MKITANYNQAHSYNRLNLATKSSDLKTHQTFQARLATPKISDNLGAKLSETFENIAANVKRFITPLKKSWEVSGKYLVNNKGYIDPIKGFFASDIMSLNEEAIKALRRSGVKDLGLGVSFNDGQCLWGNRPIKNAQSGYLLNKKKMREHLCQMVDACLDAGMKRVIIICDDPLLHTKEAKVFFKQVSNRYKDNPHVIYEICAEAGNPGGKFPYEPTWGTVKDYANEIIPAIRKNAPDSIIIVGTDKFGQNISGPLNDPLNYKNIIHVAHPYIAEEGGNPSFLSKTKEAYDKGLCIILQYGLNIAKKGHKEITELSKPWFNFIKGKNSLFCYFGNSGFNSDALKGGTKLENLVFKDQMAEVLADITNPIKKAKPENN